GRDNLPLALVFNPRQLQLLAQDRCQFIECDFDFEGVLTSVFTGFARAVLAVAVATDRIARFTVALSYAARLSLAKAKLRDIDLWNRDADSVLALPCDQFAVGDVLLEVLTDLAPDDIPEA